MLLPELMVSHVLQLGILPKEMKEEYPDFVDIQRKVCCCDYSMNKDDLYSNGN